MFHNEKIKEGRIFAENSTDADNLVSITNTQAQAESLMHNLDQATEDVGLYMIRNKNEYMCFKRKEVISIQSDRPLKLAGQFTYLGSNSHLQKMLDYS